MAAPVDLELKKAFTELQAKVIDTQQKVKLADIQIEQLNRTKKHAHLTDTEIMTLVDETNMYEGVGRMYCTLAFSPTWLSTHSAALLPVLASFIFRLVAGLPRIPFTCDNIQSVKVLWFLCHFWFLWHVC
uniref:Prefoldin subunit 1 n=1 Tax=Sus scrofa TaxID=9823 RepID=A0A8D0IES6_PIG